jgi:hypothetical protein
MLANKPRKLASKVSITFQNLMMVFLLAKSKFQSPNQTKFEKLSIENKDTIIRNKEKKEEKEREKERKKKRIIK